MFDLKQILQEVYTRKAPVLDAAIPAKAYVKINLSISNTALVGLDISDPEVCGTYVNAVIRAAGGLVAYGGYLEQRKLYTKSDHFNPKGEAPRNIHLGVDFWAREATSVHAPIEGIVHSMADNKEPGNYGPTVILSHGEGLNRFYTLYGHLSRNSLNSLTVGSLKKAGEKLGRIGAVKENGGYAPHLHFQLIRDIGNFKGDYPGVCTEASRAYYSNNCPDPEILWQLSR